MDSHVDVCVYVVELKEQSRLAAGCSVPRTSLVRLEL